MKMLIFCDFHDNLTPTLFMANFLVHIFDAWFKRYLMQQQLTYLCTDINENGPSLMVFLKVDQFYVLRFFILSGVDH